MCHSTYVGDKGDVFSDIFIHPYISTWGKKGLIQEHLCCGLDPAPRKT